MLLLRVMVLAMRQRINTYTKALKRARLQQNLPVEVKLVSTDVWDLEAV